MTEPTAPPAPRGPGGQRDRRQVFIPAPDGAAPRADRPLQPPAREAKRTAAPAQAPPAKTTPPAKAPPAERARRGPLRWLRRRWRWLLAAVVLLVGLGAGAGYLWAKSIFDRIEKVPVASVLSTDGRGTNYLLVGSDSRANIDPNAPNAGAFLDDGGASGQRSDTMLVLHLGDGGAKMLSIPRDLYVTIAETGSNQKINAAFNGGPTRLIRTIQDNLGIPIHHYIEVDFVSFAGLVDALGGVTVNFAHPAYDRSTGLVVRRRGAIELDGDRALAYVRSRNYVEIVGGEERTDFTADLGRIQRQQSFLRAVMAKMGDTRNPITLGRAASKMAEGLRIDDTMTVWQAMRFAWALRGLEPKAQQLPVDGDRNAAGSVLVLRPQEAKRVLDGYR